MRQRIRRVAPRRALSLTAYFSQFTTVTRSGVQSAVLERAASREGRLMIPCTWTPRNDTLTLSANDELTSKLVA